MTQQHLVFDTPGLIDVRAFTLMGVSAKPNTASPIGYFGTGLKYAVAVLVRLGCQPAVTVGLDRYVFKKFTGQFRGKDYTGITMSRLRWGLTRWQSTQLPYSTEYGRNWQPWMVYRELESNTRDEGGETYVTEGPPEPREGRTLIAVELPEMVAAHADGDKVFLPGAQREGSGCQVVAQESELLYWRGLCVLRLPKPALQTYNLLDGMLLTEDRTAYEFIAKQYVARWLATGCADEDVIKRAVGAEEESWEHDLEYDENWSPSPAFHRVMMASPRRTQYVVRYYDAHDTRVEPKTFRLDEAHPFPWRVEGDLLLDKDGSAVFAKPHGYVGSWGQAARSVCAYLSAGSGVGADAEEPWEDEPVGEDAEVAES